LRQENERLRQQLARQQALIRLARCAVGLAPPAPAKAGPAAKKKPRQRVARALTAAARLRADNDTGPPPAAGAQQTAP
jgi:hypothetical protein